MPAPKIDTTSQLAVFLLQPLHHRAKRRDSLLQHVATHPVASLKGDVHDRVVPDDAASLALAVARSWIERVANRRVQAKNDGVAHALTALATADACDQSSDLGMNTRPIWANDDAKRVTCSPK